MPRNAHQEWWRRAEIPAANGQGNARSVAAIQSIIAGRGEARGVRLLSAEGTEPIFEVQAEGIDKVLGVPERMGMGYGLSNPPEMPLGPRACYWGGYGGSSDHHGPGRGAHDLLRHEPHGVGARRRPARHQHLVAATAARELAS